VVRADAVHMPYRGALGRCGGQRAADGCADAHCSVQVFRGGPQGLRVAAPDRMLTRASAQVFRMDREVFARMPWWRRMQFKKVAGLF